MYKIFKRGFDLTSATLLFLAISHRAQLSECESGKLQVYTSCNTALQYCGRSSWTKGVKYRKISIRIIAPAGGRSR